MTPDAPRTEAEKRLLARGSNNWTGDGWIDTFREGILAIEAEAATPADSPSFSATYDPEAEAVYVTLSKEPHARTVEVDDETNVDLDAAGRPIGVEVLNVNRTPADSLDARTHEHSNGTRHSHDGLDAATLEYHERKWHAPADRIEGSADGD